MGGNAILLWWGRSEGGGGLKQRKTYMVEQEG